MNHRPSPLLTLVGTALLGAVVGVLATAAPAHAATINYVALGDSYSSGVGAGGDDPPSGACLRRSPSYTPPLAGRHSRNPLTSIARRGAAHDHVTNKTISAV